MKLTYKGKTAGSILKTAQVKEMRAGNFEIVVTAPDGADAVAMLGTRADGWGGTVEDVLVLTRSEGCIARVQASESAVRKLRALESQVNRAYS
jgi:hypothetical protein